MWIAAYIPYKGASRLLEVRSMLKKSISVLIEPLHIGTCVEFGMGQMSMPHHHAHVVAPATSGAQRA